MKKAILSVLFVMSFIGCVSMPTQEEINKFDYGTPISIDYQKSIKQYFDEILFDPYSAVYEFSEPQQYWFKEAPLLGGKLYAGYLVYVTVNAKNRMGGYTGKEKYGFLFKNNSLSKVMSPEELGMVKT